MKMFSADDSFELSEEDFLQAAVDIENLCPETGPLKRTSFELGVGTDRSCSPKEKITQAQSTTTSDISTTDQLLAETPGLLSASKLVGRELFDKTGPLKLTTNSNDGRVDKRDMCAFRDELCAGVVDPARVRDCVIEPTLCSNLLPTSHQFNSGANVTSCALACNNTDKSIQNNLFSIGDLGSDPDLSLDNGHGEDWEFGIEKAVSVSDSLFPHCTAVHLTTGQLSSGSPSVELLHTNVDTVRKTSLGARCLEILRVEGQKQQSQVVEYGTNLPPRQAVSMLISHNSAFGPEIKSPGISSSHTKNAHKQVSDVSEISRVLQTPVKSLGGLGLTEASPMTHQPLWKEGPVRTRPVSLRATKKRKFPGPAGKLPQLTSSEVFDGVAVNRCDSPVITPAQTDVVCNQSCEAHFQDTAWLQMISELQPEAQSLLQQFTVTSVIRKASKKQLHQGKVPVMCVLIDAIGIQHTADASVLLRDQTGVIKGTVHHQLLKDYPAHFQTGTALVLRQVGVFSPSTRTHYLNITPNNIVCIYMKEADDNIVIEKLNQFTADDFVLTDSASLVASNQGSNMHHRRMSPGTLFSSATPNVCSNMTRSQTPDSRKTISQTPGKLQSPACIKTVPQSPSCNRTVPQSPVCNRTVLQSPICSRTVLQSPACNRTVLQSPVSNRTVLQSPVCSRTVPQTPACNRTVPRAPACNRTVPRAPACNRVPQSPVSNRTVLEMTDQSKVFNFKTLQASSALHTSAVVNTVVSHGSIESVTHHPGNCGLEDLLSGLDDEMLAEF